MAAQTTGYVAVLTRPVYACTFSLVSASQHCVYHRASCAASAIKALTPWSPILLRANALCSALQRNRAPQQQHSTVDYNALKDFH